MITEVVQDRAADLVGGVSKVVAQHLEMVVDVGDLVAISQALDNVFGELKLREKIWQRLGALKLGVEMLSQDHKTLVDAALEV